MSSYSCCKSNNDEIGYTQSLSATLKLVSDPSRLKILCILRSGSHCVCELLEHIGLSQSLVSHHLKDLREGGIVRDKKEGSFVYYSLTEEGQRVTDLLFKI